ncbi:hypothetical protein BVY02_01125 [bacterium J17]|nr:hypothetical protein BVY02_01125 [bacterium J17]
MNQSQTTSRLRYSVFYFLVYGFMAYIIVFFPLHCMRLGFGNLQTALILSAGTLMTTLGSPAMLRAAHYHVSARSLLIWSSFFSLFAFAALNLCSSFWSISSLWCLCLFAHRGSAALIDAQAIRDGHKHKQDSSKQSSFEASRLWGSLGFVVFAFLVGLLADIGGQKFTFFAGLSMLLGLASWSLVASKSLRPHPASFDFETSSSESFFSKSTYRRRFSILLLISFLVWASHAPMYVYFSIYLSALGWTNSQTSLAWNIGVISEIAVFLLFARIQARYTLEGILKLSAALTALRWLTLYFFHNFYVILFSQVFHAFSFGTSYLSSVKLVFEILPDDKRDRGQGMLIMIGIGLGSLVGRLIFGFIAEGISLASDMNELFIGAALCSALAYFLAELFARKPTP